MRLLIQLIATLAALTISGATVRSASSNNVQLAIQAITILCVGTSTDEQLSLNTGSAAGVSVGRVDAGGDSLGPEARLNRKSIQGLVVGLNNVVSGLAAEQANRARDCMKPYLDRIVNAIIGDAPPHHKPPGAKPPTRPGVQPPINAPENNQAAQEHYVWGLDGCLHRTPHGVMLGLPPVQKCRARVIP
jgi:hypothetical protein